ncbi:MAG: alpha/beta fold hydrolase [Chloroflexota bacterium]
MMMIRGLFVLLSLIVVGVGILASPSIEGVTAKGIAQSSPPSQDVCTRNIVVQSGDTLSALAYEHLGSFGAYASIIEMSNVVAVSDPTYATIESASLIRVGWKLCVAIEGDATADDATTLGASTRSSQIANTSTPISPAVPSPAPTTAPTPTPVTPPQQTTRTDGELHPLTIESMRQQSYPGSTLVFEETLAPGANYDRYVASYQSEGLKIFGLLTVPNGEKPAEGWPIIIFNHGYIPPEVYRTTERYVAYQDAFARSGYITFKPDYRAHGSSEGENPDGNRYVAYTADVLNAMASIQQLPDADSERVGMWGHSMGGQITLRAMVVSEEVKAGSIWAGTVGAFPVMYDRWQERARTNPNWGERTRRWREELVAEYGTPEENPDFWAAITPNTYVADLSGPIQLQHGSADSSVPVAYSDTLSAQIQAVDGTVEYYQYPGDDHNLSANLRIALNRSVAFFDQYLK